MIGEVTIPRLSHPDDEKFAELMESSYRKVYNTAYRLVGNKPDAEDLTQEAFYRAYRSFGAYEGDKPFENWILRIVTRLFLDLLRSRRRRVKAMSYDAPYQRDGGEETIWFDMADVRPNPEDETLNHTLSEEVQASLDQLSPEQQLLVRLADIEQVPYSEIAQMLNKPVGTVRSRLHRAHKQMRETIERARRSRKANGLCLSG